VSGGPSSLPDVEPQRLLDALRVAWQRPALTYAEAPALLAVGGEARVDAFRLEGAPREAAGPLVLRRLFDLKDPRSVRWGAAVHAALGEVGYPVPRVLWHEEDLAVLDAPALVAERVPGRMPLAAVTQPGGLLARPAALPGLVVEALARLPRYLGETHASLHGLDPEPLRRHLRQAGFEPEAMGFRARSQRLARDASTAALDGLDAGFDWVRTQPVGADEVICHGDFVFTNLCVDAGRVSGVFDWSNVALAEPEYDVAATCARLTSTVPGLPLPLAMLFRAVQGRLQRRYLRCYRRTRGLDEKRVAAYEAYWILHELVWSGRRFAEGMRFDGKIETRWLHPDAISAGVARFREITGVSLQPEALG
jgi:aminoglycoside phosphotransferase (APT) family kinase protein